MTLTFVFTDIEGSTRLWEAHHEAMARALATHDRLISTVVAGHGGRLVKAKGEGDSTFSVFDPPGAGGRRRPGAAAGPCRRALAATGAAGGADRDPCRGRPGARGRLLRVGR